MHGSIEREVVGLGDRRRPVRQSDFRTSPPDGISVAVLDWYVRVMRSCVSIPEEPYQARNRPVFAQNPVQVLQRLSVLLPAIAHSIPEDAVLLATHLEPGRLFLLASSSVFFFHASPPL